MIAVVQRVARAEVRVGGECVGAVGTGLLVLVGVHVSDGENDAAWLAERLVGLRVFEDEAGKMNLSVAQARAIEPGPGAGGEATGSAAGGILLVPNFTLCAQTGKGHRPSFIEAMRPEGASGLFDRVVASIRAAGVRCETGRFGADMRVELVNSGPVTVLLNSAEHVKRPTPAGA
jgi:D-tyrosyl-tRNA(Tyr) deacylase